MNKVLTFIALGVLIDSYFGHIIRKSRFFICALANCNITVIYYLYSRKKARCFAGGFYGGYGAP